MPIINLCNNKVKLSHVLNILIFPLLNLLFLTLGDLKFDPLQFKPENPLAFKLIQTKEINNGRLAMLAIAGIVAQELVTGEKIF
jgi:Chlorophyll A-B binding protein